MYYFKHLILTGFILITCITFVKAQPKTDAQGSYFAKKEYVQTPLPKFEETIGQLPAPIMDEKPLWIETYRKAWEIAFRNFYEPTTENGFVSQYIDAAFNNCIFLWDGSFLTMFCNYAHPLVPGIATLDNFYIKQYPDGEICREISRVDGQDCPLWVNQKNTSLYSSWGYHVPGVFKSTPVTYIDRPVPTPNPVLTLDAMNHPIMAWAEWESYKITGDKERLKMVYPPLVKYYQSLQKYIRQGNGLYMTDWASMDNSARNPLLEGGGMGVDISSEMVLFARNLADMATMLNKENEARQFTKDAVEVKELINKLMWNRDKNFYFDLQTNGKHTGIKTVAAYWTLLAEVATPQQAKELANQLKNPKTFGRRNLVPTLAGDEPGFSPNGNYWRGAVWAPTTTMVVEGLEKYGYNELAGEVALNHIELVAQVYKKTGTIWESYSPDSLSFARLPDGKPVARDFVGWSGIGPIKFLLEYGIGLKADAPENKIIWTINSEQRVGCERFRFNNTVVSLIAETPAKNKRRIVIESDKAFNLEIIYKNKTHRLKIKKGHQAIEL